eukprot:scaffold124869_cov57-Phaeocystis_antarctica.AAC.2
MKKAVRSPWTSHLPGPGVNLRVTRNGGEGRRRATRYALYGKPEGKVDTRRAPATPGPVASLDNISAPPSCGAREARQHEGTHGPDRALGPSLRVGCRVGAPDGRGRLGGGVGVGVGGVGVGAPWAVGRLCGVPRRRRRAPRHAAHVVAKEGEGHAWFGLGLGLGFGF